MREKRAPLITIIAPQMNVPPPFPPLLGSLLQELDETVSQNFKMKKSFFIFYIHTAGAKGSPQDVCIHEGSGVRDTELRRLTFGCLRWLDKRGSTSTKDLAAGPSGTAPAHGRLCRVSWVEVLGGEVGALRLTERGAIQ